MKSTYLEIEISGHIQLNILSWRRPFREIWRCWSWQLAGMYVQGSYECSNKRRVCQYIIYIWSWDCKSTWIGKWHTCTTGVRCNLTSTIMVLADLGRRLNAALSSLNKAPIVDEKVCSRISALVLQMNQASLGSWCDAERNHCRAARIRCQRQIRCVPPAESQSQGQSNVRECGCRQIKGNE